VGPAAELLEMREAFPHGKVDVRIDDGTFKLGDYQRFLGENQGSITRFKAQQQAAFEAERQRWVENGQLGFSSEVRDAESSSDASDLPPGAEAVESHVPGSVWKLLVRPGERVKRGQTLLVVESMKMEIAVESPRDGVVLEVLVSVGRAVAPGQRVAVLSAPGAA
jgi:urea carboxylase